MGKVIEKIKNKSGSSLIEVLVSLAIFSTVILGLCSCSIQSLHTTLETLEKTKFIIQTKIAHLGAVSL